MKFFYADALDHVDPRYNFERDSSLPDRIPQRDDRYAHEIFEPDRPYDGVLISKYLFDLDGGQGRYSQPQRFRFLREGARAFLRLPPVTGSDPDKDEWPLLGDCGAFNYRAHDEPPYTVDEVLEFYESSQFSYGVSVDHMIGAFDSRLDSPHLPDMGVPPEWRRRFDLTIDLADEFLRKHQAGSYRFRPIGIAQGWSPRSYREAVRELMDIGYDYIALGGLVPLRTADILKVLRTVREETGGRVPLHLFGITRLENFDAFSKAGVVSLDSSSPMLQAFKDAKSNYYASSGHYTAVRVPQADKNRKLRQRISSGEVDQGEAIRAERDAMAAVRSLHQGETSVDEAIRLLKIYENLWGGKSNWQAIRRTLQDRPWQQCPCAVCEKAGVEVIIFRCSNRNKRRGFHNLWFTHKVLRGHRSRLEAIA